MISWHICKYLLSILNSTELFPYPYFLTFSVHDEIVLFISSCSTEDTMKPESVGFFIMIKSLFINILAWSSLRNYLFSSIPYRAYLIVNSFLAWVTTMRSGFATFMYF